MSGINPPPAVPASHPSDDRQGCIAPFCDACPPPHLLDRDTSGQPYVYLVLNTSKEGIYFSRYF